MSDKKLKIRIHIQQPKTTEMNDSDDPDDSDGRDKQDIFGDSSRSPHWIALEKPPFDSRKIAIAAIVFVVLVIVMAGYMLIGDRATLDSGSFDDDHLSETRAELSEKEQTQEIVKQADNHDARMANTDVFVPRVKPSGWGGGNMLTPPKPATKPVDSGLKEQSRLMPPQMTSNAAGAPVAAGVKKSVTDYPGVIRAQLTRQIRQREPVDNVDHVLLERGGSSSIYFFIELSDFENQQLGVDWYFEDRLVTETKLHIGARKWRTHAKKLLSKGDAGVWRVILRDQMRQVLAERRFVVKT